MRLRCRDCRWLQHVVANIARLQQEPAVVRVKANAQLAFGGVHLVLSRQPGRLGNGLVPATKFSKCLIECHAHLWRLTSTHLTAAASCGVGRGSRSTKYVGPPARCRPQPARFIVSSTANARCPSPISAPPTD